jgi:DnaJ-class molecular chaperone
MPNHYEILGVSKDADESEIKKAFRKMSLQYHPDRNINEDTNERFQEINEAFEILSDPNKRNQHDMELQFGQGGGINQFSGMGQEMNDINNMFNMMFGQGGGNPFGNIPGMPGIRIFHNGGPGINVQSHMFHSFNKPEPVQKIVEITAEQSYHGCSMSVQIDCWSLNNNIKSNEVKVLQLNIPAGVDNDETLVIQDQGNSINNKIHGDIRIIIKIKDYGNLTRKGLDLILNKKISLKDALCGFNFEFDHYNGKRICMNNSTGNNVIKPGMKKVINGLGMIRDNNAGNMIVEFDVIFPDITTEEQRESLRNILV